MDNQEVKPPEPIHLPEKQPDEPRPGDVIVISQATIYYFVIAVLFFVAGFAVAWITFSTTTNNAINSIKAEVISAASGAAQEAVATAVASIPRDSVAAVPTPIPRQNVSTEGAPAWGPPDAKVTIVEFSDFQCPYCEIFFKETYPLIREKYGNKVRFVYRNFPLTQIHPDANRAALAAECANEQGKFWEYHDMLFNNQKNLSRDALVQYASQVNVADSQKFAACLDSAKFQSKIQSDFDAGIGYSVSGTPTFFINGNILVGAQRFEAFAAAIDAEMKQAGG
jgi:protein-disulfide isomerase